MIGQKGLQGCEVRVGEKVYPHNSALIHGILISNRFCFDGTYLWKSGTYVPTGTYGQSCPQRGQRKPHCGLDSTHSDWLLSAFPANVLSNLR